MSMEREGSIPSDKDTWKKVLRAQFTRRRFILYGGLFVTGIAVGKVCFDASPATPPEKNKENSEVMNQIEAGSFFDTEKEVYNRLTAFKDSKVLLPIFPPAIYQYKDLIYNKSLEYSIPVNVVATIMAIESAGNKDAESNKSNPDLSKRAQGLFQVLPSNFRLVGILPDKNGRYTDGDYKKMKDPLINIEVAMRVFTSFLTLSQNYYKGKNVSESEIYIRALMGYNGGTQAVSEPLSQVREQTRFYKDHALRYLLVTEAAQSLKNKGLSDQEILGKMSSPEIGARAFALRGFREQSLKDKSYSYDVYYRVIKVLGKNTMEFSQDLSKNIAQQLYYDYLTQRNSPSNEMISPATLIWNALGGEVLFNSEPKNIEPGAWQKIDTSVPSKP